MIGKLTKRQTIQFAAAFLIILIVTLALYFFMLRPIQQETASVMKQQDAKEKILESMKNKQSEENILEEIEAMNLQKQLPSEGREEELILDFDKAQVMSDSRINNISFETEEAPEESEQEEQPEGEDNEDNQNASEEREELLTLPEGVHKITMDLSVEADDYESLEGFLSTIEGLERLIIIEGLSFTGTAETTTVPQQEAVLNYQVQVAAYYLPDLVQLIEKLPAIDTPPPSNKDNPLSVPYKQDEWPTYQKPPVEQNPTVEEEEDEEDNEETNQPQSTTSTVKHTVQPGETLFRISMKYYHSRKGEAIIRKANNLEGNKVYAGQVLTIPLSQAEK